MVMPPILTENRRFPPIFVMWASFITVTFVRDRAKDLVPEPLAQTI